MKITIVITALLLATLHLTGQDVSNDTNFSTARHYLDGFKREYNPQKAIALFKQGAAAGDARCMNALGLIYNGGKGVETNKVEALAWFKLAANAGYANAWLNLGNMYKYGQGTDLNFDSAYLCYANAAAQNLTAKCSQAYMLYKGLGCTQNYTQAVELFTQCAQAGNASAMFMLGMAYASGYGVTADTAKMRYWICRADTFGYTYNFFNNTTDTLPSQVNATVATAAAKDSASVPARFKKQKHNNSAALPDGQYCGYLTRYDWSGLQCLSKTPVTLALTTKGKKTHITWVNADSSIIKLTGQLTDSALVFNNTLLKTHDRYKVNRPMDTELRSATLAFTQNDSAIYLAGNLRFWLTELNEPDRPAYLSLQKSIAVATPKAPKGKTKSTVDATAADTTAAPQTAANLTAYPNPFTDRLNLSFTLSEALPLGVTITNIVGKVVYSASLGNFASGSNTLNLTVNLPAGTYVVALWGNGLIAKTIAVKQ